MDKPKRHAKPVIRWQVMLLALVMTGLVMFAAVMMNAYQRMYQTLDAYGGTLEAMPRIVTATPMLDPTILLTPLPVPSSLLEPTHIPVQTDCRLPGYTLYECQGVFDLGGRIDIEANTIYRGVGTGQPTAASAIISGDNRLNTLFHVRRGATLRLENISLVNSSGTGILVDQGARLIVSDCEFSGHGSHKSNTPGENGSAIFNNGIVVIDRCTFDHNYALGGGAALFNTTGASATIRDSHFYNNSADGQGDFGGAIVNYGSLTIENTDFEGNHAVKGSGGALASLNDEVKLVNVIFENNVAKNEGGAIYNGSRSMMILSGGRIRYNTAREGGGIFNWSLLEIIDSYIDLNTDNCYNTGTMYDRENACN